VQTAAVQEVVPVSSSNTSTETNALPARAAATQETAPATKPDTEKNGASSPLWWGIGLGVGAVVIIVLYFSFAGMERKTTSEFETTIIDDIISALKDEYSLSENDLRNLASGIVATRRCSDSRLADLLRIEYEVEKTSSSHVKRTTAIALKKQNDIVVKKATRTMTWEDLPAPIRKEFILKNESVLTYSLYSDKEGGG